jgi:hypothetical protein
MPKITASVSLLDGPRAATPVDDVKPLQVPDSVKLLVKDVAAKLTDALTDIRPAELQRTEPPDVDPERLIWVRTIRKFIHLHLGEGECSADKSHVFGGLVR